MAKITVIDEKIPNLDQAWAGVDSDGKEWGYDKARVEEFIKETFKGRVGHIVRSQDKEEDGFFHVRGFADQDSYNEWLADKEGRAELVITHFTIPDMSSTTASYVLNLVNGSGNFLVSTDDKVVVKLRFVSALYSPIDQSTTDSGESGVLTVQTRINETAAWATKGTIPINSLPKDSTSYTDVDISQYLSDGQQQVRMIVRGETSEANTNYATLTVVKTSLSLEFANDWENPITNAAITPKYRINGSIEKTLNIVVDGVRTITSYIGEAVYLETPYEKITIVDSDSEVNPVCTQGIHTIEAWLSVDKNGVKVESEHVKSQVLIILDDTQSEQYVILNNIAESLVNWTEQTFFSYAVYNSADNELPLTFTLYDYNRTKVYASYPMGNVPENSRYTFSNMVEIEETYESFSARLDIMSGNTLLKSLVFEIDNTQNFSPTAGADFIFNPKLRSNEEENPSTVINAVTGEVVEATFTNFGHVNDAYTVDEEGNKCFRVLAGDLLHITGYEAYSGFMGSNHTSSLTMEFDFAVRNVTNEDDPILRMCTYDTNGNPIGWEMRALSAMFGTQGLQVRLDQDIAWSENKRTHVAVNIVYNLAAKGINYIRIFVNGKINREMSYLSSDTFVQYVDGVKTSDGIYIGAPQAEIDIYSIRIYKKALSSADVQQDRVAAFPTSAEKIAFREANDILVNNAINYEKTKAKYNTLLWKPNTRTVGDCRLATYGDKSKQLQYGDLVISILGDPAHSGVLYNENTQGQGTSSMSYWKWNQRFQPDDDGYFVNELGERFELWQLMDGMPRSSRNDAKINWASPMQSHKLGATALYHDCWKKIVKNNTITSTEGGQDFTGTEGGYADCRVAVRQKPFFMFVQKDESSEPEFYALFTMGPGKGDKPTFGYDKSMFPDFTMLEGCDNDKPLVMHRVPWDSHIEGSVEDEIWKYNGEDNWELSMGSGNLWEGFKVTFNFVYLLHTDIKPYVGTYAQLISDPSVDTSHDYWVTVADTNAAKFDLFRYDIVEKAWLRAGLERVSLNVDTQCGNIAGSSVDWDSINDKFIAKRIEMFKGEVEQHYHKEDALYTMMFLRLHGATDNRGKNTYLYRIKQGDPIMFFQDDLDSIKPSDNVGRKTKPYWVEEHDLNALGQPYWNSSRNAFYNLMEQAFPDECRSMMNSILTAMAELGGGTLEGCYQKYFYDVQEGIPAVAYNEIARLLYEDAAVAFEDGRYTPNTPPLPQCLGDQLESEREWDKKRSIYCSSYASYGEFAAGEVAGALAFRSIVTTSGASPRYSFTVVPHLWLYPANGTGDSVFPTHTRVKAGESFTFPERTSDGNTNVRINGINYYRHIGEFGDKSVGEAFSLSGERLTEFSAASTSPEFRITSMKVSAPNLERIDLTGISTLAGALDLSGQRRLGEISLSGTSLTSLVLPNTDTLTSLTLPSTLTSLRIDNQPALTSVSIDGTDNLQVLYIDHGKAKNFDSKAIITSLYRSSLSSGKKPSEITLLDVNWVDLQVEVVEWLCSITNLTVTGKIAIKETSTLQNAVTWDIKNKINLKFGNVDDANSPDYQGLLMTYAQRNVTSATLTGNFYNDGKGEYPFTAVPNTGYANTQTKVLYSIDNPSGVDCSIDPLTGVLKVNMRALPEYEAYVDVTVRISRYYEGVYQEDIVVTKSVKVYDRQAELADLVYADGTFSSLADWDGTKTPIGICCYIAPRYKSGDKKGEIVEELFNPLDTQQRLMLALEPVSCTSKAGTANTTFAWGAYKDQSAANGLFATVNGSKVYLRTTDGSLTETSFYDIPTIVNATSSGLKPGPVNNSASYIEDGNFRDESDTSGFGLLNDGFLPINAGTACGDGFAYEETATELAARTLDSTLATLAGGGYKEGDVVNSGYAKTLKIIAHRNKILTGAPTAEGLTQPLFNEMPIPAAGSGYSELDSLAELLDDIAEWASGTLGDANPNKWRQLYYPAASAAYAYEPTVTLKPNEVLADKFKAHNWFLPTNGINARIRWYLYSEGKNIFAEALDKNLLTIKASSTHWSSTEYNATYAWYVYFNNGYTYYHNKYNTYFIVGAVAAF